MTDALPYRGSSDRVPFFAFVESERPSYLSISCAGVLTILLSILTVVAMDYEVRHPIAIPILRPKVEEPPSGIAPRPDVVFSCVLMHGTTVRLSAQVKELPNRSTPSGQMRFLVGYETLKIVKLQNGAAALTVRLPKSKLHETLQALYLGDDNYAPNYSNVGDVVQMR